MNKGLSEVLLKSFPNIQPSLRPLVNTTQIPDPMWVAGFASGESSFNIHIGEDSNTRTGYKVGLRFQITQHSRDAELLKLLINYFNCGGFYSNENQEIGNYIVSNLSDISEKIVPFFEKYPISGIKSLDFLDFKKVAEIVKTKGHLTPEGFKTIENINSKMNHRRV